MVGMNKALVVALAILLPATVLSGIAVAENPSQKPCEGRTWTGEERMGRGDVEVEYEITFDEKENLVCVSAINTGEIETLAGYSLYVDDRTVPVNSTRELDPGDSLSAVRNITTWMDATAENHTVNVGTYGGTATFNFTQRINESKQGGVPTPQISDVEIVRDHRGGEITLKVTAKSHADRVYSPSLVVKTFETPIQRDLPSTPDNNTLVYKFRLEEGPNETVVGEIKLYEHWKMADGKFDKVEFVSEVGKDSVVWDAEFKNSPTLEELNADQKYENESARKYRDQGPDVKPISETESKIGAVLTVALLVGAVWWRRRRKYR